MNNRKPEQGFTLIELLVSIAIFATIAVVLYSSFRAGIVSYQRVNSEGEFQQKLSYIFETITKDLKNMIYFSSIPFEGSQEKIGFVTTQRTSGDIESNVARVSYYIFSDEEVSFLAREEELLKDFLSSAFEEETEEEVEVEPNDGVRLLDNVSGLKFSYLKMQKDPDKEDEEAEYEWLDIWEEEDILPAAVKIDIVLDDVNNNQKVSLTKRIWIPVGCTDGDTQTETEVVVE